MAVAVTWLPGMVYCALLVVVKRLFVGRFVAGESQDATPARRFRFWLWSRLLGSPFYLGTLLPFSFTPVVPWYFRLLGASVGRDVWMVPPNNLAEFDLFNVVSSPARGTDEVV